MTARGASWRGLALALGLGLAACACGGAGASSPAARGGVIFAGGEASADFDPDEPRLAKAREQVAALLGHPLELSIDAALVPKWSGSMAGAILDALEAAAQDLAEMKQRAPQAFTYAKRLERIKCMYTALAPPNRWQRREVSAELSGSTLVVKVSAGASRLVPRGLVRAHLTEAWERETKARIASQSPRDVAPADQVAWVDLVTRDAEGEPTTKELLDDPPMAKALPRVIALEARATGAGKDRARKWLARNAGRWFARAHDQQAELVRKLDAGSGFRRAEDAWSTWALAHEAKLPDEERLDVMRALFARANERRPGDPRHAAYAFPKVNRLDLALRIVDEWRAGGHLGASRDTTASRTHEFIVCPRPLEGKNRPRGPRCDHDLYDLAFDDPGIARRFTEAIAARRDPILADQVFANFEGKPIAFALATWRALENEPVTWRAAGRVLIEELSSPHEKSMLIAEARRLWRTRPDRRGTALYLLVHADRYANGAYDWDGFEEDFGQKIGRAELDAFLSEGTYALLHLPTLWPALADMPRGPSILRPLERAWADPTSHGVVQQPYGTTRSIVHHLCEERAVDDVRAVKAVIERFAASRGEHAGPASRLAAEIEPDKCAKKKPVARRPRGRALDPFAKKRPQRRIPKPRVKDPFGKRKGTR